MKFPIGARIAVATLAAVGVATAGIGVQHAYATDRVDLVVDGAAPTTNQTREKTVGGVLESAGVKVGAHDEVQPSLATPVTDGMQIVVNYGRPVTLTVDGQQVIKWTTAKTLDEALGEFSLDEPDSLYSVSRSTSLGRAGLSVDITTAKDVTVKSAKGAKQVKTPGTVADALTLAGITADSDDKVSVPVTTTVTDGLVVTFQDVESTTYSKKVSVKYDTTKQNDSSLAKGKTKVATEGVNGTKVEQRVKVTVDGKVVSDKVKSTKVTKKPVTEVVKVGTKQASSSSSSDSSSVTTESNPTGSSCVASFYDEPQLTASGEQFNPQAMTAAHKTLPLGTKIKVTNPKNGKTVVVRINDRGPYIGGRCLDLSAAAFGAIGNTGAGTMTVVWSIV